MAGLIGVTIGSVVTPILVTEATLHIAVRPRPERAEANAVAWDADSTWEPARIKAADDFALEGWLFTPRQPNGSGVILLHGVGDSRTGMLVHAGYLLRAGFTVLTPDSRGHGSSGGSLVTYGIREAADVHAWASWLLGQRPVERLYGLGESMGAATLLQSLPVEPRFRALVAECSFDTFDVAYYRLESASGLGHGAAWLVAQFGLGYTRLIYGVNLKHASPAAAIRTTRVPVLLIHGTRDVPPPRRSAIHRAWRSTSAATSTSPSWSAVPRKCSAASAHQRSNSAAPVYFPDAIVGWVRDINRSVGRDSDCRRIHQRCRGRASIASVRAGSGHRAETKVLGRAEGGQKQEGREQL